jgi:hypothetical protein
MLELTDHSDHLPPSDVCLLLRAHAEQHWLTREVKPLLRELTEGTKAPNEDAGAALAYLEVLWIEACRRAAETDAAFAELDAASADGSLHDQARGYRSAVYALRSSVGAEVTRLIEGETGASPGETQADRHARDAARFTAERADHVRSGPWRPASTSSRTPPTRTAR